jgi:hypothetical protein
MIFFFFTIFYAGGSTQLLACPLVCSRLSPHARTSAPMWRAHIALPARLRAPPQCPPRAIAR